MESPTIITVTHNTWGTFTSRLISTLYTYTNSTDYSQWFIVDNNSKDGRELVRASKVFPIPHLLKLSIIHSDKNIGDLPQYNRIIDQFVETEKIICISTDVRIFRHTIPIMTTLLDYYDMIGVPGPNLPKGAHIPEVGGNWHWVPRLLEDRNLDFDSTAHIQTHCFGIRKSAFMDVGGFWEPDDENWLDKGNLITGEIMLGVKLRKAGYRLGICALPVFHYGNTMRSLDEIDEFDRRHGWDVDFPRIL